MIFKEPIPIRPTVQNYHWGKVGRNSLISRLIENVNESLPYAELWYGAHIKSPSKAFVNGTNLSLNELLRESATSLLGESLKNRFGNTLPFLAKILSIDKALSIQAHPSKENAALLFSKDSINYPDCNHKPEIAIALTDVELLHGWISHEELSSLEKDFSLVFNFFKRHQIDLSSWNNQVRKALVQALFSCQSSEIAALNNALLKATLASKQKSEKQNLYLKLAKQVDLSDSGLILALFLRYLQLLPTQAMFTPAGEIHAYLSGDLFECMANSDNVIRAGLTPKFQDTQALLDYSNFEIGQQLPQAPSRTSNEIQKYSTQVEEFEVRILEGKKTLSYGKNENSPELLISLKGLTTIEFEKKIWSLKPGEAILLPCAAINFTISLDDSLVASVLVPGESS